MTDRLDRIETDLETVKEILFTTARRVESADNQIENLTQLLQEQNRIADERGRRIDAQIENLTQSLQEQSRLADVRGRKIDERFEQLREDVDIAFQTISLLSENTDRSMAEFRAEMRDSRAETRAIWEYLMRKSQNGDGNV